MVYSDTFLLWFFPRSNKPGSSPKGQTPDESSRRTDANSSVSDLANSVTSDMLMVSFYWNLWVKISIVFYSFRLFFTVASLYLTIVSYKLLIVSLYRFTINSELTSRTIFLFLWILNLHLRWHKIKQISLYLTIQTFFVTVVTSHLAILFFDCFSAMKEKRKLWFNFTSGFFLTITSLQMRLVIVSLHLKMLRLFLLNQSFLIFIFLWILNLYLWVVNS